MSHNLHALKLLGIPEDSQFTKYEVKVRNTLLGWQPKVFLLNTFTTDLVNVLAKLYKNTSSIDISSYLYTINKLLAKDLDYVRDNEYIDHIKFILEQWHPELIFRVDWIGFVYKELNIERESYENAPPFKPERLPWAKNKKRHGNHNHHIAVLS